MNEDLIRKLHLDSVRGGLLVSSDVLRTPVSYTHLTLPTKA